MRASAPSRGPLPRRHRLGRASSTCSSTRLSVPGRRTRLATRYARLTFDEALSRKLQIMDATAFALCRDQKLPIKVFSIMKPGALKRVVQGEDEGTLVHV